MPKYDISIDEFRRPSAEIAKGLRVAIQILPESDARRSQKGIHAFAVLDIQTALGPMRSRHIHIQWSRPNERFFVRWPQERTGRMRDGRPERLDIIGPRDVQTRCQFEQEILGLFDQVKLLNEQANKAQFLNDQD